MFHHCHNRSAVLYSFRHYQSAVKWTLVGIDVYQRNVQFFIEYIEENFHSIFEKYSRVMVIANKELWTKITSNNDQVTEKLKEWITMSNEVRTSRHNIIIIQYVCLLSQAFLPGTSLEPTVIPTTQASSFTLQYFPYYVWCSKYSCLL